MACRLSLPAQTTSTLPTFTAETLATQTLTATLAATDTAPAPTPSPYPTITSYPTVTPYPTITPIPSETPIPSVTPLGAGPTAVKEYSCQLLSKYPDQWAPFKPNTLFKANWELKNTGSKPWYSGAVELKYISGVKMYANNIEKQELSTDTGPGNRTLIIVQMISPKKTGEHATTWALVQRSNKNVFCAFTTKIVVK